MAAALAGASAVAQSSCAGSLQALELPSGIDGALHDSIYWDRDGGGPLPPELVIAGAFRRVGGVVVNGVARQDAVLGWQPIGAGVDGIVYCLAVDGANRLVLGGAFASAGGTTASNIARFDGAQFSALAAPPPAIPSAVRAIATRGIDEVVFIATTQLHVFDGSTVFAIPLGGGGSVGGQAVDVATLPSGKTVVAGAFTSMLGQTARNIAVYDWATGTVDDLQGGSNAGVQQVAILANGDFYAFGSFSTIGGVTAGGVALRTQVGWQGFPMPALGLAPQGGAVSALGNPIAFAFTGIKEYVGGAWQSLLSSNIVLPVTHLRALASNMLLLGYGLGSPLAMPPFGGYVLGGVGLSLASGVVGNFQAAATLDNGDRIGFLNGAVAMSLSNLPAPGGFVRLAGGAWSVEPTGPAPTNAGGNRATIQAILPQDDGSYIAAGDFTVIGGAAIQGIARFDGSSWQPLGSGPDGGVLRAVQLAGGDIVVLRVDSSIARFDGVSWQTLAPFAVGVLRDALAACRDGSFVAYRRSTVGSAVVAALERWNGGAVASTPIPGGKAARSLAELRDGSIAIAMALGSSGVLRAVGSAVQPVGALVEASATAIAALPDGGIVATIEMPASVTGNPPVARVMRWDGASWLALTDGGRVKLESQRDGSVLLIGDAILDGARAASIATIDAGCPSASNAVASGCASGAGVLASDAPWLGQTLRLEATGLPLAAFAIAVGSTQSANLPLAGVFATAIPGCTLLVQPDVTSVQFAIAGVAQLALSIPNTPSLVGAAFREQFVHFALDPSLAVGATNALDLVVGSY